MRTSQSPQPSLYRIKDSDLIMTTGVSETTKQYVLRIRDLPDYGKPRERLIKEGPAALSLQELLSIVLNVGTTKEGVLEMSQRIVREYGTNALLNATDAEKLSQELDIPVIKACQVISVGELGRRLYKRNENGLAVIRNAQEAYDYLKDMHALPKEQMRGIYLDTHNRVIHDEVIAIGTVNSNITHPREVFRPALEYNAAAMIIAHNHPSGIAEASGADVEITRQLVQAGKILGVHILDHIIVTKNGFKSVDIDY